MEREGAGLFGFCLFVFSCFVNFLFFFLFGGVYGGDAILADIAFAIVCEGFEVGVAVFGEGIVVKFLLYSFLLGVEFCCGCVIRVDDGLLEGVGSGGGVGADVFGVAVEVVVVFD